MQGRDDQMTATTPNHKPGDVVNDHVLTEGGQWVPIGAAATAPAVSVAPVKKKHTVRNVLLGIVLLSFLFVGGCLALIAGGANEVSKSIAKDANKPGGTDNPLTITAGKAFEVDHFDYAAGWTIGKDALGDINVKGLKVTNNRDSKDSALVEIKLWKGTEVLGLVDCTTEPIGVGTTVSLSCSSADNLPKQWTKVTINDSF
jgi:hypothetical protein